MPIDKETLLRRLDRLGIERMAQADGLPALLAARVAEVIVDTGLPEDRRAEVYHEMVGHFLDGLGAGQSPEALLAAFGDGAATARMIRHQKRQVTPETSGGTGAGDGLLTRLARDLRYATRRLRARPAFTATAVLSLALGIGANAAMFTLINSVIFRKPPLADAEQLVHIYSSRPGSPFDLMSYADIADLARGSQSALSGIAASNFAMLPSEREGQNERLVAEMLTADFFKVLGLRPVTGRFFDSTDAPAPGTGLVAVLGNAYWRRAYGGRADAVGQTIRLAGQPFRIVGVAPAEYSGSMRGVMTAVFVPVTTVAEIQPGGNDFFTDRSNQGTFAMARLRPGVTLQQAQTAAGAVVSDLRQRWPGYWQSKAISLIPDASVIVWPPIDRVLVPVAWMLMVVVGLVLVIACANLAAFLLARAIDRRKEIAVRLALGATRRQLVAQLLVETIFLALLGGAAGVVLGRLALQMVLSSDLPLPIPLTFQITLDWRVLGFAVAVSIIAGAAFGLAPALQSSRLDLASVIRDESTGGGRQKGRLRNVLLIGQVAVAVTLLIAAGLFVRSLDAAKRVDPGFGHAPTVIVWLGMPGTRTKAEVGQDWERIERRLRELPGVEGVGLTGNIHLNATSNSSTMILVDGVEPPPGELGHSVDQAGIDTGFVSAMGLELRAGRAFRSEDLDSLPRVAIVNEAFVKRFWPGQNPIGRRFRFPSGHDAAASGREIEVVGLVNTAKIRTLAEEPRPFVYFPRSQEGNWVSWLIVRTRYDADAALKDVLAAVRQADPESFVMEARTMTRHIAIMSLPFRLGASALSGFAVLALIMASVGLYGAVSYAVAQRSREVGIRLSLGADRGSVIRLLLWGGLRLVLVGVAVGILVSMIAVRLLQGLLFGVHAVDPLTFLLVPAVLLAVAGLAAYFPARRAGRIDPVQALRAD